MICETPPFPEYNSTHAATAATAAGVLALELGDRHSFTVTSKSGARRRFSRFSEAAREERAKTNHTLRRNNIDTISLRTSDDYLPALRAFFKQRERRIGRR